MSSLHTKFRPEKFEDVLGQDAVVRSLKRVVKDARARTFIFTGPSGCVDGDTEFLSPNGWIRIADFKGEKVAQFNLNGTAEWVTPTQYIKKPCNEFFHLKTKYGIDQMLSGEHRVLYLTSKGNWAVKAAKDVIVEHERNNCGFSGKFATTFAPTINGTGINLSDAELRLMVAFLADGSLLPVRTTKLSRSNYKPKKCAECKKEFDPNSGISLHCPSCRRWWGAIGLKKARKIQRLETLLVAAKVNYAKYEKKSGYTTFYFNPPIRTKSYEGFWCCTTEQLNVISSEVKFWDGRYGSECPSIHTLDQVTADFVQYAITSSGYRATINVFKRETRTEYSVTSTKVTKISLGTSTIARKQSTDGYKYCFEVPSSYLVLRRNNRIFITGNTGKTTLARILAAEFAGVTRSAVNLEEVDGASKSGADATRELVTRTLYRAIGGSATKFVIYDEAHRLSAAAWTILLKPVEEPPPHVYYAFCTTEVDKIPKAIVTRCLRYDLKPVKEELIAGLLVNVADSEQFDISDDILESIAENSNGSPRQALIFLEACLGCKSLGEAREIMRNAGQTKEVIDLARYLVAGKVQTWAEATKYLKELKGQDAEGCRLVLTAYFSSVLLGTKKDESAARMLSLLECFSKPYYSADKIAPLLLSVGMALNLDV